MLQCVSLKHCVQYTDGGDKKHNGGAGTNRIYQSCVTAPTVKRCLVGWKSERKLTSQVLFLTLTSLETLTQ